MTARRLREAVRIDVSVSVRVVRGGGSWDEARVGSEGSCRNMTRVRCMDERPLVPLTCSPTN